MINAEKLITIAGLGSFLPGSPIENQDLSKIFNVNEEWVEYFIGNKSRHFALDLDNGQPTHNLADICTKAALEAIDNSDYFAEDIEFIVMATATPDNLMPATVNLVAENLQINLVPTYQLQSGCAGAIQALDLARKLLLGGSYKVGLVIGGDVCNKHIDLDRDFSSVSSSELVNYLLFGDGAGAAVVTSEVQATGLALEHTFTQLTGLNKKPGQVIDWFGKIPRDNNLPQVIKEDYKAIEKTVPVMATEILYHLLDEMQWDSNSIDFFLPPQLSGNMTDRIVEFMNIPQSKAINCVAETGNNGNALPFLQLERLEPLMESGQKALGIAVESSKWIKSGLAISKI
ncbi:MAG: 3-oxoacyl-ACP synthase III family protein [Xenococcaceae cyanobacterium MO_167.B27]|nr:3-oxoacyl-ACP synthase III family protein [Xenococcaceae cyanobacterium MO_167.B27]